MVSATGVRLRWFLLRPVPGSAGLRPSGCAPSGGRSCRTSPRACARISAGRPGRWHGRRPPRRRRCRSPRCWYQPQAASREPGPRGPPRGPRGPGGPPPGPGGPVRPVCSGSRVGDRCGNRELGVVSGGGCEADDLPVPVHWSGIGRRSGRGPRAGPGLVRHRAVVVRRWYVVRSAGCCGPDDPREQLIRPDEADRGPGRDDRADEAVGPALGHVHGERGEDAEREHPAGQPGDREAVPRRVQDDHAGRVHQAVDRGGFELGGHAGLAVLADDGVGVPVGDVRRDARHGEHDGRRGDADRAVHAAADGGQVPARVAGAASAVTGPLPGPGRGGR